MSCLCELISNIKKELPLYGDNEDASKIAAGLRWILDKIFIGDDVLPALDEWLQATVEDFAKNKENFLSNVWAECLLEDKLEASTDSIYKPYIAERRALNNLIQAIERLKNEKPYNPLFNYNEMLAAIETRKTQIEWEKDYFEDIWRTLHKDGASPTSQQISALLAAVRTAYKSGYVDQNSISNLDDYLHFLVGMVASTKEHFGTAFDFYEFFAKESFFPSIDNWIREALEIRLKNMSFITSSDFIDMLMGPRDQNALEFAWRYKDERDVLNNLQQAIEGMMKEMPDNPFMDYNQLLSDLATLRGIIDKEAELFRGLWDMLHPDRDPDNLTKDQIKKILDKLFTDCCDDDGCGCGEPDCVCGCEEKAPSASEIPLGEVPSYIYDIFMAVKRFQYGGSPVILDLDGDGVESVDGRGDLSVKFDLDGDGRKSAGGWASANDGLLAFDRNRDGVINNGGELFGDNTVKYDGTGLCHDGFEALAQEDTNGDGVINQLDNNWDNFKIWRDLDQDGLTDSGELFTLGELGISSINVAYDKNDKNLSNGNYLYGTGSYTTEDGQSHDLADIFFSQNHFDSEFTDPLEVPDEIKVSLPN